MTEEILLSDTRLQNLRIYSSPGSTCLGTRKGDGCAGGWGSPRAARLPWTPLEQLTAFPTATWLLPAREIQAAEVSSAQKSWVFHPVVLPGLHPSCFPAWSSLWSWLKCWVVKNNVKLSLQITSPAWHRLYSLPAKSQLNLGNFLWLIPRPSNGFIWSTQVRSTSTKIKSGLQRSNKKLGVWRLEAFWLPGIQQKSSLVLKTEPVCST